MFDSEGFDSAGFFAAERRACDPGEFRPVSCLVAAFLPQLRGGLDQSIRALITPEPNLRRLIVQTYIFPELLLFFWHAKPWISSPNSSCQETLASA